MSKKPVLLALPLTLAVVCLLWFGLLDSAPRPVPLDTPSGRTSIHDAQTAVPDWDVESRPAVQAIDSPVESTSTSTRPSIPQLHPKSHDQTQQVVHIWWMMGGDYLDLLRFIKDEDQLKKLYAIYEAHAPAFWNESKSREKLTLTLLKDLEAAGYCDSHRIPNKDRGSWTEQELADYYNYYKRQRTKDRLEYRKSHSLIDPNDSRYVIMQTFSVPRGFSSKFDEVTERIQMIRSTCVSEMRRAVGQ